mmetsp:Transcript_14248/g.21373  ORF Transcript_14248/g.21373 Transcript_14248/m.21373 type:complete len:98 (+) Transcript_14248:965-1258(+)
MGGQPQCKPKPQIIPAKCPMNDTRGMMNWAINKDTTGAILNLSCPNEYVEKQTSLKKGTGQVGCFRSNVEITIHANSTPEYPTELVSRNCNILESLF